MAPRTLRLLAFTLALQGSWARAQIRLGQEFQVNTYTTSGQVSPSAASDADGNFVIVWASVQQGLYIGVFGQRYASTGIRRGTEFQIRAQSAEEHTLPSAASDADGDFVVVWENFPPDASSFKLLGQRYASSGAPLGSEFQANTYTLDNGGFPKVASDADGDFVVVWESFGQESPAAFGVFGQRYASNGARQGGEFQVNTYTTRDQRYPSVASDVDGNFVVVWHSLFQDGSDYGVFGQRYASSGAPRGGEFRVNTSTAGNQLHASVASAANGDFAVVWQGEYDGDILGIFGQRYASSGAPRGGEFQVNAYTTGSQNRPRVASSADGDFAVVWTSAGQDGDNGGIFGRSYASSGEPQGGELQVNTTTTGIQQDASVASDADRHFVVAWDSDQVGSVSDVFGQRYARPTRIPTATPTVTRTATATGTPRATPTTTPAGNTSTPTPSATRSGTGTPAASGSATATATNSPTPTAVALPQASASASLALSISLLLAAALEILRRRALAASRNRGRGPA